MMARNPFYNAVLAVGYIVLVAHVMYYGSKMAGPAEPSVLVPIAILSLFVLSAAMMGYLFLDQPLQMYLDGQKQEAVDLFLKTLGLFAAFTLIILIFVFLIA